MLDRPCPSPERQVSDPFELDEPRRPEALRCVGANLDGDDLILAPVKNERGHAHRWENLADVDFLVHAVQSLEHPRTCCVPDEIDERLDFVFIVHTKRSHGLAGIGARRIDTQRSIDFAPIRIFFSPPRKVRRPHRPRRATANDQRRGPLGIGRREQDAHRRAFGQAVERGTSRADRVHDCPHVVHTCLEARSAADRVGHAGAAFVESNQPRERAQVV